MWRPVAGGACLPAGPAQAAATVAELADVSKLPALPAAALPLWCAQWTAPAGGDCAQTPQDCAVEATPCAAGPAACAAGQFRLPGPNAACLPAGVAWQCPPGFKVTGKGDPTLPDCAADPADCGAQAYAAADLAADGGGLPDRLYVDAAAAAGGDGSRGKPLQSLQDALALAEQQTAVQVVAVAAGSYDAHRKIKRSLTVRGRCAAMVQLTTPSGTVAIGSSGSGVAVAVEKLHFAGAGSALQTSDGAQLLANRCWVTQAEETAAAAFGAGSRLALTDTVIADTQLDPAQNQGAVAVWADDGARADLQRCRISRSRFAGILATGPSTVTARELVIDGTEMAVSIKSGYGIYANQDSQIRVVQASIHKVRAAGVGATGAKVSLLGVAFDGALGDVPGQLHSGAVNAIDSSDVAAAGCTVNGLIGAGFMAGGGSQLRVGGSTVAGLVESAVWDTPVGILGGDGAQVTVISSAVSASVGSGVGMVGAGTVLNASGVVVGPLAMPKVTVAHGLEVVQGATATVSGLRATGIAGVGVLVKGSQSRLELNRAILDDCATPDSEQDASGVGLLAYGDASADIADLWVHRAQLAAVAASDASRLRLRGLLIDRAGSQFVTATDGLGVYATDTAEIAVAGARILDTRFIAVGGGGGTPVLRLAGVLISDRFGIAQATTEQSGIGASISAGKLQFVGSRIERVRLAGINAYSAAVDLRDTAVVGVGVGAKDVAGAKLADGVALAKGSSAQLQSALLYGNLRAGMSMDAAGPVAVQGSLLAANLFGVAVVGGAGPVLQSCAVAGNSLANTVSDQGLPMPPPPAFATVPKK